MKNKLFLVVAPIVAIIYLCFVSYPIMVSLLKMITLHKGDPEISDGVRYFVTAQYMCMAFFPPFVCLIAFITEAVKTRKKYPRSNSINMKPDGDNPYAPPAIEPSRCKLKRFSDFVH